MLFRSGASPNPNSELYKGPEVTARVHKKLNKIKKRKYQQTHNLLSGDTERAEDREKHGTTEWISHWHPNITISICYDQTAWPRGKIPPPLDRGMILLVSCEFGKSYFQNARATSCPIIKNQIKLFILLAVVINQSFI